MAPTTAKIPNEIGATTQLMPMLRFWIFVTRRDTASSTDIETPRMPSMNRTPPIAPTKDLPIAMRTLRAPCGRATFCAARVDDRRGRSAATICSQAVGGASSASKMGFSSCPGIVTASGYLSSVVRAGPVRVAGALGLRRPRGVAGGSPLGHVAARDGDGHEVGEGVRRTGEARDAQCCECRRVLFVVRGFSVVVERQQHDHSRTGSCH